MAGQQKLDVTGSDITAQVGLGIDGKAFGITAILVGRFPTLEAAQGRELMEAAHQVCPYSRATLGNIDVTLEVAEQ